MVVVVSDYLDFQVVWGGGSGGVSVAICRYEGHSDPRVLAALWTAVVGRLGWLCRVVSSKQYVRDFVTWFVVF